MRIETPSGAVVGAVKQGVACFFGIPFASPPTGTRRFLHPQPPEPWHEPFAALHRRAAPPQSRTVGPGIRGAHSEISEDCLHLNIFVPASAALPRAVIVWIFGGGYVNGDAADPLFDGSNLARAGDVVVVTINYRLGVWGFAPLRDQNVGLADQVAALRWISIAHRRVRRRRCQRHDRRGIRRRDERLQSARVPSRARDLPPCDRTKRRRRSRRHARAGRNGRRDDPRRTGDRCRRGAGCRAVAGATGHARTSACAARWKLPASARRRRMAARASLRCRTSRRRGAVDHRHQPRRIHVVRARRVFPSATRHWPRTSNDGCSNTGSTM